MTLRERILIGIIAGLLVGFVMHDTADAQGPAQIWGVDSSSGLPVPIQTDGSNALKILGK